MQSQRAVEQSQQACAMCATRTLVLVLATPVQKRRAHAQQRQTAARAGQHVVQSQQRSKFWKVEFNKGAQSAFVYATIFANDS